MLAFLARRPDRLFHNAKSPRYEFGAIVFAGHVRVQDDNMRHRLTVFTLYSFSHSHPTQQDCVLLVSPPGEWQEKLAIVSNISIHNKA